MNSLQYPTIWGFPAHLQLCAAAGTRQTLEGSYIVAPVTQWIGFRWTQAELRGFR
jgi:hypothetical protein